MFFTIIELARELYLMSFQGRGLPSQVNNLQSNDFWVKPNKQTNFLSIFLCCVNFPQITGLANSGMWGEGCVKSSQTGACLLIISAWSNFLLGRKKNLVIRRWRKNLFSCGISAAKLHYLLTSAATLESRGWKWRLEGLFLPLLLLSAESLALNTHGGKAVQIISSSKDQNGITCHFFCSVVAGCVAETESNVKVASLGGRSSECWPLPAHASA